MAGVQPRAVALAGCVNELPLRDGVWGRGHLAPQVFREVIPALLSLGRSTDRIDTPSGRTTLSLVEVGAIKSWRPPIPAPVVLT